MDVPEQEPPRTGAGRRRCGWPGLLGVLAAWLVAGVFGALAGRVLTGAADDPYAAVGTLLGHVALPALSGLVVGAAAVGWLRWWPAVLREPSGLRLRGWAWSFPAAMAVVAAAVVADWPRLGAAGTGLLAALVVTVLLVAASEEVMFRGLTLLALRDRYPEVVAALLMTALFAVLHVLLGGGLTNLGQGIASFLGGWVYYLTRRVSGGLLAPVLLHAWWDLAAFSRQVGAGVDADNRAFEGIVALFALCLVSWLSWRFVTRRETGIEPGQQARA